MKREMIEEMKGEMKKKKKNGGRNGDGFSVDASDWGKPLSVYRNFEG